MPKDRIFFGLSNEGFSVLQACFLNVGKRKMSTLIFAPRRYHSNTFEKNQKKRGHFGYTVGRKIIRPPSTALFFFALWKLTSKLLLVTSCSMLCRCIYAISFSFVFLSIFIFLKKRKDTHEFLSIRPDRETVHFQQ